MVQRIILPQATEIGNISVGATSSSDTAVNKGYVDTSTSAAAGVFVDSPVVFATATAGGNHIVVTTTLSGPVSQFTVQTTGQIGTEVDILAFFNGNAPGTIYEFSGFGAFTFTIVSSSSTIQGLVTVVLGAPVNFTPSVPVDTLLRYSTTVPSYTKVQDVLLGTNLTGTIANNLPGRPTLTINAAGSTGVSSLNGLTNAVALTSTDNSLTISTSGQNLNLRTTNGPNGGLTVPAYIQQVVGNFEGNFAPRIRIYNGKAYVFCSLAAGASGGTVTVNNVPVSYMYSDTTPDVLGFSFHMPNSFGVKSVPTQVGITGLTITAGVASFTLQTNTIGFDVGAIVTVANATPASLNGNYRITVRTSATAFSAVPISGQSGTWTSGGTVQIVVSPYVGCTFRTRGNTLRNLTIGVNSATVFLNTGFARIPYIVSEAAIGASDDPTFPSYQHPLLRFSDGSAGSLLDTGIIQPATYADLSTISGTSLSIGTYFGSVAVYSASKTLYDAELFGTTRWYLMYEIESIDPTGSITSLTLGQTPLDDGSIEIDLTLGSGSIGATESLAQTLAIGNTTGPQVGIVFQDGASNTVGLRAPAAITTSYNLQFPPAQATAANQALVNNGSGFLSWGSPNLSQVLTSGNMANAANIVLTGGRFISNMGTQFNGTTSGNVLITAPATIATSYTLTLPAAQGVTNTTLINDGSGTLTWGTTGNVQQIAAISTANVTPSGGSTVDGYTPVNGDLVLLTNQTTVSQQGLYLVSTTAAWNKQTTFVLQSFFALNGTTNNGTTYSRTTATTNENFIRTAISAAVVATPTLTQVLNAGNTAADRNLILTGTGLLQSTAGLQLNGGGAIGTVTLRAQTDTFSPWTLTLPNTAPMVGQTLIANTAQSVQWANIITPIAAATTVNVNGQGDTPVDGYTPAVGDVVLLAGQTSTGLRGLWTVTAGFWTPLASLRGQQWYALNGTVNANSIWIRTPSPTTPAFARIGAGANVGLTQVLTTNNTANNLNLIISGTGTLQTTTGVQFNGSTSGSVTLRSPAAPGSYILVLPTQQAAEANQALVNNGLGTLSWGSPTLTQVLSSNNTVNNTNLVLTGTGTLQSTAGLRLNGSSSGNVGLSANASTTAYNLVLPTAQGAAGQVMVNDGNGNLSWGNNALLRQVVAISTLNVSPLSGFTEVDGYTPSDGDYVLLVAQTTTSEQGLYQVNASGAWVKQTIYPYQAFFALNGTANGGSTFSATANTINFIRTGISSASSTLTQTLAAGNSANDLSLILTGTGALQTTTGLQLNGSTSGNATIRAAATTTTYRLTLPAAQASAANQTLLNDGTGNLSWGTASNTLTQVLTAGNTANNLNLTLTGTGTITAPMVTLSNSGTNTITLRTAASVASSYALTLPSAVPTFGQSLVTTDATGNTGWFLAGLEIIRLVATNDISLTGAQSVDGVAVALNDRVLAQNQTTTSENGLYAANPSGDWMRLATYPSQSLFVQEGTVNANRTYTRNEIPSPEQWILTGGGSSTATSVVYNTPVAFLTSFTTSAASSFNTNTVTLTGDATSVFDVGAYISFTSDSKTYRYRITASVVDTGITTLTLVPNLLADIASGNPCYSVPDNSQGNINFLQLGNNLSGTFDNNHLRIDVASGGGGGTYTRYFAYIVNGVTCDTAGSNLTVINVTGNLSGAIVVGDYIGFSNNPNSLFYRVTGVGGQQITVDPLVFYETLSIGQQIFKRVSIGSLGSFNTISPGANVVMQITDGDFQIGVNERPLFPNAQVLGVPSLPTDVARFADVQAAQQGFTVQPPATVVGQTTIGTTYTNNSGTVLPFATLTGTITLGSLVIDGYTVGISDRVLLVAQGNITGAFANVSNGIYTLTSITPAPPATIVCQFITAAVAGAGATATYTFTSITGNPLTFTTPAAAAGETITSLLGRSTIPTGWSSTISNNTITFAATVPGSQWLVQPTVSTSTTGSWTPAPNMGFISATNYVGPGSFTLTRTAASPAYGNSYYVQRGTLGINTVWVNSTLSTPIVVGTTQLLFNQFSQVQSGSGTPTLQSVTQAGAATTVNLDLRGVTNTFGSSQPNYLQLAGSAFNPSISVLGTLTNVPLLINSKGTGAVSLAAQNANYINVSGSITGGGAVQIASAGSDANVDLALGTNSNLSRLLLANNYRNYFAITGGSATTQPATLASVGTDTNIGLNLAAKGTGSINLATNYANYLTVTGNGSGGAVFITPSSVIDNNVPVVLGGLGTGAVIIGQDTASQLSIANTAITARGSANLGLTLQSAGTGGVTISNGTNNFALTPANASVGFNTMDFGASEVRIRTTAAAGVMIGNLTAGTFTVAQNALNIRSNANGLRLIAVNNSATANTGLSLEANNQGTVSIGLDGQPVSLGPVATTAWTTPLLAANATTPTGNLTAGAAGQVLTSRGANATPAWVTSTAAGPNVYAYALNGDQSVSNQALSFNTTAAIALGASFGSWTTSVTFTFTQTGSYQVSFSYNSTSGSPDISIVINGVRVAGGTPGGKNTITGVGSVTANNQTMQIQNYSGVSFSASQSSIVITRLG